MLYSYGALACTADTLLLALLPATAAVIGALVLRQVPIPEAGRGQGGPQMAEKDEYLRMLLNQAAAEEAFFDRVSRTEDVEQNGSASGPATSPAVSLMITSRQRAELRELGFSDEAIREMTPTEAHEKLGLAKPL